MSKVADLLDFVAASPQLGRLSVGTEADSDGLWGVRLQVHDHAALLAGFCAHLGKQLKWNSLWKKLKRAGLLLEAPEGREASRVFVGRMREELLTGHVPAKRRKREAAQCVVEEPMEAGEAARQVLLLLREGRAEAAPERDDLAGPLWRVASAVSSSSPFPSPPLTTSALAQSAELRMPRAAPEQSRPGPVVQLNGVAYRAEAIWRLTPLDEPQQPALQVPRSHAPQFRHVSAFEQN